MDDLISRAEALKILGGDSCAKRKIMSLEAVDAIDRAKAVEAIGDKMIQGDNMMAIGYNHGIADCVATLKYMPGR